MAEQKGRMEGGMSEGGTGGVGFGRCLTACCLPENKQTIDYNINANLMFNIEVPGFHKVTPGMNKNSAAYSSLSLTSPRPPCACGVLDMASSAQVKHL